MPYGDPGFGAGQPGGANALWNLFGLGGGAVDPTDLAPGIIPPVADVRPPSPVDRIRDWWNTPATATPGFDAATYGPQQPYGPQVPPGGLPPLGESLAPSIESLAPGPAVPNDNTGGGGSPTGLPTQGDVGSGGGQQALAQQALGGNALANALRGVVAPPKPDVVKPATPHIYRPEPIKQGQLFDLLSKLGTLREPLIQNRFTTLGQNLGGR